MKGEEAELNDKATPNSRSNELANVNGLTYCMMGGKRVRRLRPNSGVAAACGSQALKQSERQ